MSIKNELQELWTPGQVLITEVSFFDENTARRFTRFLNRHLGSGQASKRGQHVIVDAIPARVMKRAYLYFGALPNHEFTR